MSAALSSMLSASNRLSRAFSASRALSRCASDTVMPPNFAFQSPNDLEVRLRTNGIERLVLELRPEPVEQQAEALA